MLAFLVGWLLQPGCSITGTDGYPLVEISGGEFVMGSPFKESRRGYDETPHKVRVTSFFLGSGEVTQGLWRDVMGNNPVAGKQYMENSLEGDDLPVVYVTWLDAIRFANAMSAREALEPCYEITREVVTWPKGLACEGYRLPTEAEWEYAARAGGRHLYAGTDSLEDAGWTDTNSGLKLHPPGKKSANDWKLYDMTGNVSEWCWDWYGDYPKGLGEDPLGPESGKYRIVRGGAWGSRLDTARVADRSFGAPPTLHATIAVGLRLARSTR